MSENSAVKAEAIHRVDSAFGVLLVVAVFLTNSALSVHLSYTVQKVDLVPLVLSLVAAFSIFSGLFGILRQSLDSKLMGWCLAFLLVQIDILNLVGSVLLTPLNMSAPKLVGVILVWGIFVDSVVFTEYLVLDAYFSRLNEVSCVDTKLMHERAIRRKSVAKAVLMASVLAILMFLSSG